jgi:hypothetical protein
MRIFELGIVRHPIARVCLALLALVSLSTGQQNAAPIVPRHGVLSVSVENSIVTVRNSRTGELLSIHALGAAAPGKAPKAATGYQFQTLPAPTGATSTYANGISGGSGLISGGYGDSASNSYGLLFSGEQVQVLSYPGESQTNFGGINDEGVVVGDYGTNGGHDAYAFVYKNGAFTAIKNGASTFTVLTDINDAGAKVGTWVPAQGLGISKGFLLANGVRTVLARPGAQSTTPTGINKSGEIVGFYDGSSGQVGFSYVNGTYTTIQVPGSTLTYVNAISNNRQMAGYYYGSDSKYHSFVLKGGQFATVEYPGAYETFVYGIDDAGAIVGQYFQGTDCTLSGQSCAFLAMPK